MTPTNHRLVGTSDGPCDSVPYGADLVDALKRISGLSTLPIYYSEVQTLKEASRAEVEDMFAGSDSEILRRLRTATPAEFATYLVDIARRSPTLTFIRFNGRLRGNEYGTL